MDHHTAPNLTNPNRLNTLLLPAILLLAQSGEQPLLGEHEMIRTYVEFTDGGNRGMMDPATGRGGLPDEDFDATTAMVVNWHRPSESDPNLDARLIYRRIHPVESEWSTETGQSFEFWHREERVNRVIVTGLEPNSVYEYKVTEGGFTARFRTMPASLEDRPVRIVFTSDHQSPNWNETAHRNARMAALQNPDMFVVAGDFVNSEGRVTAENAERWALYFEFLYGIEDGYFIQDREIDDHLFENLVIPHVSILGNHETGHQHHLRWPSGVNTTLAEPGYPTYVAANWMELLFHWPFRSEGFLSEFNPTHPNMDPTFLREGFGHGGFGKLSFSDYLMLIAMDSNQNWEGEAPMGLRDWEGNLITERWPWYETHHAEVRQDHWLRNLLEPDGDIPAGDRYDYIIPVWHRGLFGPVRLNMSLKNRPIMESWLPLLYRNGVRFIVEAHDHIYARTVPMGISALRPENSYLERVHYEPLSWSLPENLDQSYIDDSFAVNTVKATDSEEIIGWESQGLFITYEATGMRAFGYGGWAAGRRVPGDRGGGNAGLWFVDAERGGEDFGGDESFHINVVELTTEGLRTEAIHPGQLERVEAGDPPDLIHQIHWNLQTGEWDDQ